MKCDNPKCGIEIEDGKRHWSWIEQENKLYACSDACFVYGQYIHGEGKQINTQWLQSLHPKWQKDIERYMEPWEIDIMKTGSLEEKIHEQVKLVVEKTIEGIRETYLKNKESI